MQFPSLLVALSFLLCFSYVLHFNNHSFLETYHVMCDTMHPITYRGSSYTAVPLYFFETVMHPEYKLSFLQYHHRMVKDQKTRFIWNTSISSPGISVIHDSSTVQRLCLLCTFVERHSIENQHKAWKPQVSEDKNKNSEHPKRKSFLFIHQHNENSSNSLLQKTFEKLQTNTREGVKKDTEERPNSTIREGVGGTTQDKVRVNGSKELDRKFVIPIVDLPRTQFAGKVSFGTPPQSFYLIFDTGSTNIQVVGENCLTSTCLKVPRFSLSKSSTFKLLYPSVVHNITFGSGKVQSIFVKDRVQLGSFHVPDQTFAIIINELEERKNISNIFHEIEFQGLLGLGFPSLSTDGQATFFDKILNQLPKEKPKQFAIYMMNHKRKTIMPHNTHRSSDIRLSSLLLLGDLCPLFYKKPLRYVKVVHEHYWEVVLKEFWVGEKKLCCDVVPGHVIFDSGTSFNTLPARYYKFFFDILDPLLARNSVNSFEDFPTLRYVLENNVEIVLHPNMYLLQAPSKGLHPAYMQLDVPQKNSTIFLLGTVAYLQHYFTVFKPSRTLTKPSFIGIAEASHTPEAYEQMIQWEQSLSI